MPTWQVVRDIIRPATRATRCRYVELPHVKAGVGPAKVFVSHTWGAPFQDLVAAVAHALNGDETVPVWVDILAVRQWPGNIADLAFEPVVRNTGALILVSQHLDSVANMEAWEAVSRKNIPDEALKKCAFFRIWCLVELAEALRQKKPVVMLIGSAGLEDAMTFETNTGMVQNLYRLVDVANATATVPADLRDGKD